MRAPDKESKAHGQKVTLQVVREKDIPAGPGWEDPDGLAVLTRGNDLLFSTIPKPKHLHN